MVEPSGFCQDDPMAHGRRDASIRRVAAKSMSKTAAHQLQEQIRQRNPASRTVCVAHPNAPAVLLSGPVAAWRKLVEVAEDVHDLEPKWFRVGASGDGDERADAADYDGCDYLVVVGTFVELDAVRIGEVLVGTALWGEEGHDKKQKWERLGSIQENDDNAYAVYLAVKFTRAAREELPEWFPE